MPSRRHTFKIGDAVIAAGRSRDIRLRVSQTYTGDPVTMPLRIIQGGEPGPKLFVTAAVHGDELNGTGVIHELMFGQRLRLLRGTLLLVPVVNIFGFENQNRYMPDRRDLNRSFPGSVSGSIASRHAHVVFEEIVRRCDYGIDLHSAASQRMNFPNVRADLTQPGLEPLARAFGCELVVSSKGPKGSLRHEACRAGCPTFILEAGEPDKVEPGVLELGVRGVRNILKHLGMIPGEPTQPAYQTTIRKTRWLRAKTGGILRFHVSPGQLVRKGAPISTSFTVFGRHQNTLTAPLGGFVLGMTTRPTVKPGEPVCHLAIPDTPLETLRKAFDASPDHSLHNRVRQDMASHITVTEAMHADPPPQEYDDSE